MGDQSVAHLRRGHILIDEKFMRLHQLTITSKVRLDTVKHQPCSLSNIQIQPIHPLVSGRFMIYWIKAFIITVDKYFSFYVVCDPFKADFIVALWLLKSLNKESHWYIITMICDFVGSLRKLWNIYVILEQTWSTTQEPHIPSAMNSSMLLPA